MDSSVSWGYCFGGMKRSLVMGDNGPGMDGRTGRKMDRMDRDHGSDMEGGLAGMEGMEGRFMKGMIPR